MKHYLNITIRPNAEANLGFIWQKVYQQVHLALVENKTINGHSSIAVSFPEYGNKAFPLGSKLRLISPTQELLQTLDIEKWLNRLSDYSHCSSIKEVPSSATNFVCFSRRQFNTNIQRLARRRAKRKDETLEQAMQHYADFKDQISTLPFVNMVSLSSDKKSSYADKDKFRLFIEKTMVEQPADGSFNCYGLSTGHSENKATVPWF